MIPCCFYATTCEIYFKRHQRLVRIVQKDSGVLVTLLMLWFYPAITVVLDDNKADLRGEVQRLARNCQALGSLALIGTHCLLHEILQNTVRLSSQDAYRWERSRVFLHFHSLCVIVLLASNTVTLLRTDNEIYNYLAFAWWTAVIHNHVMVVE